MDCPDPIRDLVEKACLVRLTMTIPTIRERGKRNSEKQIDGCLPSAQISNIHRIALLLSELVLVTDKLGSVKSLERGSDCCTGQACSGR
jgi:hypothetical protein